MPDLAQIFKNGPFVLFAVYTKITIMDAVVIQSSSQVTKYACSLHRDVVFGFHLYLLFHKLFFTI